MTDINFDKRHQRIRQITTVIRTDRIDERQQY